jgi:hypothetical protein
MLPVVGFTVFVKNSFPSAIVVVALIKTGRITGTPPTITVIGSMSVSLTFGIITGRSVSPIRMVLLTGAMELELITIPPVYPKLLAISIGPVVLSLYKFMGADGANDLRLEQEIEPGNNIFAVWAVGKVTKDPPPPPPPVGCIQFSGM